MRCEVARELLPLHVGDDLPLPQAHRLEEHLEGCLLCADEYAVFADARADLLSLAEELPPRGSLWEGIAPSLDGAADAGPAAGESPRRRRFLGWSGLAAAAALLLLFGPWRGSGMDDGAVVGPVGPPAPPTLQAGMASPVDASGRPLIIEASPDDLRAFLAGGGAWQAEVPLVPTAGEVLPVAEPVGANQPPPGGRRGRF